MKKYDVAVIGGGFAGVAAALAAARNGAKVILVDKSNCLGGSATNCLVTPFMCYKIKVNEKYVPISAGIFMEIHKKLEERSAIRSESFLEEELKFILQEMLEKESVDFLFHSYIFAAEKQGGKITSVSLATRSGVMTLEADLFIDASGDAQLAFLADCPTVLGRESDHLCQPMTLCFRVGNVDVEAFMESKPRWKEAHAAALAAGELINPRENVLVFKTPIPNVLHFNTTRVVKMDPTSPEEFTKAELLARRQVFEIYEFLKKHADGLENSFLMMTAAEIGVRESRMIVGDYVLTEQDCVSLTKFEDAIAACKYDIDIHNPEGTGTYIYRFPQGEYYTIPYRSLIPKDADNLLVAGRCISTDHVAQSSYRIMPTVCCLGEAAGVAAALAKRDGVGVREINVTELQATLKSSGAFIGI